MSPLPDFSNARDTNRHIELLTEALTIAWAALQANQNSIIACRAMRRIEKLGEETK